MSLPFKTSFFTVVVPTISTGPESSSQSDEIDSRSTVPVVIVVVVVVVIMVLPCISIVITAV